MGLPLGPTLANIFMCHHEESWLSSCPPEFKPAMYRRYIDDTFLLFKDPSHAPLFLAYVNSKHPSIRFTIQTEINNSLPFLDVNVERLCNRFETSVFRKDSFTYLSTSFFSFCCNLFKTNVIKTLLFRALRNCSSSESFNAELDSLKNYFFKNGYPPSLIASFIKRFNENRFSHPLPISSADPKVIYHVLPYFGHKSVTFKIDLEKLFNKFYPHIKMKFILVNNFKISSLFPFKDSLPVGLRSSVIYRYRCPKDTCGSEYYGSTIRTLNARIAEHRGVSNRTGHTLITPPHSAIRIHSDQCASDLNPDHFSIVGYNNNFSSLRILESLHILKNKPVLNETTSAFPLLINK